MLFFPDFNLFFQFFYEHTFQMMLTLTDKIKPHLVDGKIPSHLKLRWKKSTENAMKHLLILLKNVAAIS